jgi:hypothetical protein
VHVSAEFVLEINQRIQSVRPPYRTVHNLDASARYGLLMPDLTLAPIMSMHVQLCVVNVGPVVDQ